MKTYIKNGLKYEIKEVGSELEVVCSKILPAGVNTKEILVAAVTEPSALDYCIERLEAKLAAAIADPNKALVYK